VIGAVVGAVVIGGVVDTVVVGGGVVDTVDVGGGVVDTAVVGTVTVAPGALGALVIGSTPGPLVVVSLVVVEGPDTVVTASGRRVSVDVSA
jgi:hypothetical protein